MCDASYFFFYIPPFYVILPLFTMARPVILSFWLVVFDCTLTPTAKSRLNPRRRYQKKKNYVKTCFEQFLCHLQIDYT